LPFFEVNLMLEDYLANSRRMEKLGPNTKRQELFLDMFWVKWECVTVVHKTLTALRPYLSHMLPQMPELHIMPANTT